MIIEKIEKDGIYKNIPNEVYHKLPGISNTGLNLIRSEGGPKRYWYQYLSGKYHKKQTSDFTLGTAVHTLVLEPDTFFNRYIIKPEGVDGRTTEGKKINEKFKVLANGKAILKHEEFDAIQGMANSIKSHPVFEKYFSQGGNIEDSIFVEYSPGIWLKSRPDLYNDKYVLDIKTTNKTTQQGFIRSVIDYGYYQQAAMQLDLLSITTNKPYKYHVLIVVEDEPPYLCHPPYLLDDNAIALGRREYYKGAEIYKECITSGKWPGHSIEFTDLYLPSYFLNQ